METFYQFFAILLLSSGFAFGSRFSNNVSSNSPKTDKRGPEGKDTVRARMTGRGMAPRERQHVRQNASLPKSSNEAIEKRSVPALNFAVTNESTSEHPPVKQLVPLGQMRNSISVKPLPEPEEKPFVKTGSVEEKKYGKSLKISQNSINNLKKLEESQVEIAHLAIKELEEKNKILLGENKNLKLSLEEQWQIKNSYDVSINKQLVWNKKLLEEIKELRTAKNKEAGENAWKTVLAI
jgi:hypothetical protein